MSIPESLWSRPLRTVTPDASVCDAARLMADEEIGALVVMEGDGIVGLVSERDIVVRAIAKHCDPSSTRVSDVMTETVIVVTEKETVDEALMLMSQYYIRHVPLVDDNGAPQAMLSFRELFRYRAETAEAESQYLSALIIVDSPGG